jgi:capsular polysaccharide biosynthesis protein
MLQTRLVLNTIKRSWWIIAVTTIIAINVALLLSYRETPEYRTKTRFVVSPNPSMDRAGDYVDGVNSLDSLVGTYAEILNSRSIRKRAIAQIDSPDEDLSKYETQAVVLPGSSILEVTVTGADPRNTALLANTIGQEGLKYIRGTNQVYEISMLDPAGIPNDPISPNPERDAGLAAVLGFIFGAVVAVVREQVIVALDN